MTTPTRTVNLAKLACALAGAAWGLFWIPLRLIENYGIEGVWSGVLFYLIPAVAILPLVIWRWKRLIQADWQLYLIGFVVAVSLVLYSNSMLYTEVVRAMLLYYLTPIWCTLLARIFLRESITAIRLVSIVLGFLGMAVVFGLGTENFSGFPMPRNLGDWMGLASGFVWAVAAVLLRKFPNYHPVELANVYLLFALPIAFAMTFIPIAPVMPDYTLILPQLWWVVPVVLILVVPAGFAIMWGTPLLSPTVVGLLFMTEISVGSVTAALWAGEPFGTQEIVGVILISLAGLLETVFQPLRNAFFKRS